MDGQSAAIEAFERHRPRLQAVAHRMLGSAGDADDALQEAWLRVRDHDLRDVDDAQAWLTTVVARVCLNVLRSRRARRERSSVHVPDPVVRLAPVADGPEEEALVADEVGVALMLVLDALTPAERLAFVLHDVFGVSFIDIATALGRSEAAAQQLASRARRRVRSSPSRDADLAGQRRVVDAFFAASRDGDFAALLRVLHPDVELRIDGGTLRAEDSRLLRGADAVAGNTRTYAHLHPFVHPAVVNGAAGAVVAPGGRPMSVMAFTVNGGRIVRIDALIDPARVAALELDVSRLSPP